MRRTSTANITRRLSVLVAWFAAMLVTAALATLLLGGFYGALDVQPLARTLITLAISMGVATAAAGAVWRGLRGTTSAPAAPEAKAEAAFAPSR
jgi:hypothetical protein